jgi:hypothetical protein
MNVVFVMCCVLFVILIKQHIKHNTYKIAHIDDCLLPTAYCCIVNIVNIVIIVIIVIIVVSVSYSRIPVFSNSRTLVFSNSE